MKTMAGKTNRSEGYILIVDDERGTSELAAQRLEPLGLKLRRAANAEEASAMLKTDTPELMLLDYSLPGTNAVALLERLRKDAVPVPPFLIITGHGDETVAVNSMKAGALDYMVKDSAFLENLFPTVKKTLEKAALQLKLKTAQKKLRESEEKYRMVVDNASEAVMVAQDGMFRLFNPALAAILGFSEQELKAMPFSAVIHPADRAMVVGRYQKRLEGETPPSRYTFRAVTKAGNTVLVEITAVRLVWDGRPAILALMDNVTERRKAEGVLAEAAEAKAKFASMVSHELRSPLTSIMLGVGLVLDEAAGLSEKHRALLGLVNDNARRLGRLINNVLDFQKIKAGKMTVDLSENNICDLILSVTRSMALLAKKKGLELTTEMSAGLPGAKFDRDKICQVLMNLLSNAIAHTEKGGIAVHAGFESDMLHVSVRDTGNGIKAADLSRLFQAFEQLGRGNERKIGGTGLGLAISKEIIQAHNGKIWAESEPEKGSVFHFTLPVTQCGG